MPEPLYLDPELAARADALFRELGLDLSLAVHLFLRQSLRERGLPFPLRLTTAPETSPEAAPAPQIPETAPEAAVAASPETEREEDEMPFVPDNGDAAPSDIEKTGTPPAPEKNESRLSEREENAPLSDETPARPDETQEVSQAGGSELRQAFLNARLIGAPLRRVRSLNRLYAIGEPNDHVQGWREVYVSGDEPFALDFGTVRVELGYRDGGSLRMMDGTLPDAVLEADAVYPRDLSAVFSSAVGQRLVDVASSTRWSDGQEREQLCLRFANGCALNFAPGPDWCALWLTDAQGAVMFAPETVWLRVLDDRTRSALR